MNTIFVSSTFNDMQHERDVLQKEVLPRLQEFAKSCGETVELCDLRWGIDTTGLDERQSTSKILQICFDEIDRSYPLFVGLLGSRYGWIPDDDMVCDLLESQDRRIPESRHKSVTELEMLYAMMKDSPSSLFYFRTITDAERGLFRKSRIPEVYCAENDADGEMIRTLKKRIRTSFPQQVRDYSLTWNERKQSFSGLSEFAEMVYRDLCAQLEKRFAGSAELSEADQQERQMRYFLENDHCFQSAGQVSVQISPAERERLLDGSWADDAQNVYFYGSEPYLLDRLMASLFFVYQELGWRVIPYDCGLSMFTMTTENLLCYLIDRAGGEVPPEDVESGSASERLEHLRTRWLSALDELDRRGRRVLFLIRGMDKLDAEDTLWWLPAKRYSNIRFMLSGIEMPVCAKELTELTKQCYFRNADVFTREDYLDAYMKRRHKQLSAPVRDAILTASEGRHPQYMEFLMQRLLLLDQKDFDAIRQEGGGMEAISRHLYRLTAEAPDSLEDFVLEKRTLLEKSIGKEQSDELLGTLLSAPYGLPGRILAQTAGRGKNLPHLSVSILCRILGNLVNETIAGEFRLVSSPAVSVLRETMLSETVSASRRLVAEMEERMNAQDQTEPGWRELIASQYLIVAFRADRSGGLDRYLTFMQEEPEQVVLAVRALQKLPAGSAWLKAEARKLTEENLIFCTEELFPSIERRGFMDSAFLGMWKAMLPAADRLKEEEPIHERIELDFFMNLQCAKLAQKEPDPEAESWLLRAKSLAKEDFARYKNRIWKTANGIGLTQEEKSLDDEFMKQAGMEEPGEVMFSYGTEVQDMLTEHTWSAHVRVINSLLENLYRQHGETEKAAALNEEVSEMTQMLDPVIQSGQGSIGDCVQVIYPDPAAPVKYKPDYRRNRAIGIAKEACSLKEQNKYREALEKFEESNRILRQIYEDGKSGDAYDLSNVPDAEAQARRIRTECLRDLALNYESMTGCLVEAEPSKAESHIEKMLEYGFMFDSARNSLESKADLEDHLSVAVAAYSLLPEPVKPEKLLEAAAKYHQYYEEALSKGERKGDYEKTQRNSVNHVLYTFLTEHPESGNAGTDILLKISNGAAVAHDFENFCAIAYLMSDLTDWMQANNEFWQSPQLSLEYLYVSTIRNICSLWEQNRLWERLKEDGEKLASQLPGLRESGSIQQAAEMVSRLGLFHFRNGEYDRAVQLFKSVMSGIESLPENEYPAVIRIQHRNRLLSALSEAGYLENADKTADMLENEIETAREEGWTPLDGQFDITPEILDSTLLDELAICLMNHAIIASRRGEPERGLRLLDRTEELARKGSGGSCADIIRRVEYFRKNGLPSPQKPSGDEKRYRELQSRLYKIIDEPPESKEAVKATADRFGEYLEELAAIHDKGLFGEEREFAGFYYHLFHLHFVAGERQTAVQALLRAKNIADVDSEPSPLYGRLYTDWTAVCPDDEKLETAQKAVGIFEALRKRGQRYPTDDFAMALWNRGLFYYKMSRWNEAKADVNKAVVLWNEVLKTRDSETIRMQLIQAKRLLLVIDMKDSF